MYTGQKNNEILSTPHSWEPSAPASRETEKKPRKQKDTRRFYIFYDRSTDISSSDLWLGFLRFFYTTNLFRNRAKLCCFICQSLWQKLFPVYKMLCFFLNITGCGTGAACVLYNAHMVSLQLCLNLQLSCRKGETISSGCCSLHIQVNTRPAIPNPSPSPGSKLSTKCQCHFRRVYVNLSEGKITT